MHSRITGSLEDGDLSHHAAKAKSPLPGEGNLKHQSCDDDDEEEGEHFHIDPLGHDGSDEDEVVVDGDDHEEEAEAVATAGSKKREEGSCLVNNNHPESKNREEDGGSCGSFSPSTSAGVTDNTEDSGSSGS